MTNESQNHFQAVRKHRASRAIVAQIRDMIAGGHLRAADRLPPERELAQLLGVGRSTLREAVRVLEAMGLVEVRPGAGTFLMKSETPHAPGHLPPDLFSQWTARLQLFELRAVLEPGLAGLAARRATPDKITRMSGVLDSQAAKVQRGESGMDEDVAFHVLVADATGNPALVHLMETLSMSLQETRDASLQRNGRPARSLRQNRAILAAIEARNPTLAARRMQAHIRSLERVLFAVELRPAEVLRSVHAGGNGFHSPTGVSTRSATANTHKHARADLDSDLARTLQPLESAGESSVQAAGRRLDSTPGTARTSTKGIGPAPRDLTLGKLHPQTLLGSQPHFHGLWGTVRDEMPERR